MKKIIFLLFIQFLGFAQVEIEAPAGNLPTQINEKGKTILPNGRIISPLGKQIITAPHPFGLAISPDGKTAVTSNSGIRPFSITIIKNFNSENPEIIQVPKGYKNDEGILEACFMGLAFSPDSKTIYVSGGESNHIFKFDVSTGKPKGSINCKFKTNKNDYSDGYLGDMVISKDGKKLYVVDQIGFRIVVIDVLTEKILQNVQTGRYPFGICLTPDESKIMVANVGVFEYKKFADLDDKNLKGTAHTFPSSKYGSETMLNGDSLKGIPALGNPNSENAFSVWVYTNLENKVSTKPIYKVKTGFLVGQMVEDFPAVGGSSPNSMVASNDFAYVSNGNNDCLSVVNLKTGEMEKNINLSIDERIKHLRGNIPFGLAISPDEEKVYVCQAGINAVTVIDTKNQQVLGHIPTAWFPSKVKVSLDGKNLIVANAKGFGSGPNGGKTYQLSEKGSYIGGLMNGVVSVFQIPDTQKLVELSKEVVSNNFNFKSKTKSFDFENIKYIVFISKENRTYDEIFGQLKNGNGDASIARFGNNVTIKNKSVSKTLKNVNVMPNHLELAKRFSISDNFFCDSDVSADGHRWMVGTYPNEWCETETAAAYGGKHSMKENSNAPGNLGIYGSAGSIYPEDYNEAGSLWDHLDRNKVDFFNFGFGVEMAGAFSDSTMKYIGELYTVNYPLPAPLFDKTSKVFPTYNMAIPDQFRADLFMKEFKEKLSNGNLPPVITLMLPNDHGTGERPKAGFPFHESYMADNDLAVGRTIEFLSKTPYWKNMAVFVTEDDPQGGVDHVDAHRSILMVASPYAKKNHIGKVHYSFGSIFKTFWKILKIPYLNQYDAGATDLSELFTNTPDFSEFHAVEADKRIFEPSKAMTPLNEKFDWKAFSESEEMDKTENMRKRRDEDDKKEKRKKN